MRPPFPNLRVRNPRRTALPLEQFPLLLLHRLLAGLASPLALLVLLVLLALLAFPLALVVPLRSPLHRRPPQVLSDPPLVFLRPRRCLVWGALHPHLRRHHLLASSASVFHHLHRCLVLLLCQATAVCHLLLHLRLCQV